MSDKILNIILGSLLTIAMLFGSLMVIPSSVQAQTGPEADVCREIQGGTPRLDGDNIVCDVDDEPDLFGGGSIFESITNALLFLVGAISVIMLIIGGIRYVVSAGDANAVTGAKNTILYAIVGIIVAFLAYAAVRFVTDRL